VPADHPFYPYIRCLKCRRILGGYSDGTFRPDNYITRGQLSKIVANAASIQDPVPPDRQSFSDVPPTHPFWVYIERLSARGIIGGYADGTFRPDSQATRGQIARLVAQAAGIQDPIPPDTQSFSDVPPTHPFWVYIERLSARGIIGGYADGTFRPDNNATRGQTAKIETNAFFPDCRRP
jgi:endo-1,4-beta-xylanase